MIKILMCSPDYFEIAYQINPWMDINNNSQHNLAKEQWQTLYDTLIKIGCDVKLIDPVKDLPDMVFTANAGFFVNDVLILANFKHPQRQGEQDHFEKWFLDNGYAVTKTQLNIEGAGDVLSLGDECIGGYGFRTDKEVYNSFKHIKPVKLINPKFYHLDTCFCPLANKDLMYYPNAFDEESNIVIKKLNYNNLIEVEQEEAERFACNAVCVDRNVVMPDNCPNTKQQLEAIGYTVYPIPMSEFLKSGGACKCLTLELK